MSDNVRALRDQLRQLEARRRDGRIGKKDYERQRAALERAILDHVLESPPGAVAPAEGQERPSTRLFATVAAAVLVIAAGGYAWTGSPALLGGVPSTAASGLDPSHGASMEAFAAAVERLAEKLKSEPGNAEGWSMLARSYVQLGRFPDSLPAFEKALQLAGEDARLLTDYADALAVTRDRNLEGEPMQLIERALKADPDNLKALALAGTAAFNRKDYATAVRMWERMETLSPADSSFMPQLKSSIAEARQLGGMPPGAAAPAPGPAVAAAAPTAPAAEASAALPGGATLTGTVRLAASLKAAPDDTLFIYARPAEGARLPLAIVRRQAKDLPLQFTLDDSLAMSSDARLSMHPKVIIEARISKSGQAQASPGDLFARTAPLDHNARGVVVEIGDVVK